MLYIYTIHILSNHSWYSQIPFNSINNVYINNALGLRGPTVQHSQKSEDKKKMQINTHTRVFVIYSSICFSLFLTDQTFQLDSGKHYFFLFVKVYNSLQMLGLIYSFSSIELLLTLFPLTRCKYYLWYVRAN